MIHRLIIYDRSTQLGLTVFDRGTVAIERILLMSLIDSMVLLSKELGMVNIGSEIDDNYLKEIEIGHYQISLLDNKSLTYIIQQDTYDNELFTRKILNLCVENFHDKLTKLELTKDLDFNDIYQEELSKFIRTLNFPDVLFNEINDYVADYIIQTNNKIDLLFLTDLDNGIAKIFCKPKLNSDGLIKILMHVLSEIPLEKSWIGESRISELSQKKLNIREEFESWIIQRIGLTEFCLVVRGFYNTEDRDSLIINLEILSDQIHDSYINWSLSTLENLEEEPSRFKF